MEQETAKEKAERPMDEDRVQEKEKKLENGIVASYPDIRARASGYILPHPTQPILLIEDEVTRIPNKKLAYLHTSSLIALLACMMGLYLECVFDPLWNWAAQHLSTMAPEIVSFLAVVIYVLLLEKLARACNLL